MLEEELKKIVESNLEDEQAALRKRRQTTDNIFYILHSTVKTRRERRMGTEEELRLTFVDLKAAFDSIY